MMSLPAPLRRSQWLTEAVCEQEWPELRLFPYNATHFIGFTKYNRLRLLYKFGSSLTPSQLELAESAVTRKRSISRMMLDDMKALMSRAYRKARRTMGS
jgi:hypothetical protein